MLIKCSELSLILYKLIPLEFLAIITQRHTYTPTHSHTHRKREREREIHAHMKHVSYLFWTLVRNFFSYFVNMPFFIVAYK
jgi:hypothetical protein